MAKLNREQKTIVEEMLRKTEKTIIEHLEEKYINEVVLPKEERKQKLEQGKFTVVDRGEEELKLENSVMIEGERKALYRYHSNYDRALTKEEKERVENYKTESKELQERMFKLRALIAFGSMEEFEQLTSELESLKKTFLN